MANRQQEQEIKQVVIQHLGVFYPPPPCSYLMAQIEALQKICDGRYGGSVKRLEDEFIKPVKKLLETLQRHGLPITYVNADKQTLVLVHLTEPELPEKMEPGEVVIWARKSVPGTLCMKHTRYVTKNGEFQLPKPHYEATKMKIEDKDIPRCLTRSYFSELRKKAKENGVERYSLMLRLLVAHNTITKSFKSLDYDRVLVSRRKPRARRPSIGVQETGDDPVATSTEAQELHERLRQYREYRATHGSEEHEGFRSPSPTGTGASDFNIPGEDTSDEPIIPRVSELAVNSPSSSDDDVHDDNQVIEPNVPGPEPEAKITLQFPTNGARRPLDGYVGSDEAVGPGETGTGEVVAPPVAAQPIRDEYVSQESATKPDTL